MALQGSLDDFSLPEILQLIAVQQKSGVLRLTSGEDLAVIFFEGGRVVSTRDRRRSAKDPLKPFLLQTGRLTEAQLRQIETIEAESRRDLTDVLLSGNYLSSEQLGQALEHQIQDTLHQLLTWKAGTYHFSGDARTVPKFAVNVRLNTEGLLMESMRRMDESVRYKESLSSPAMVLRPKALAMPPKEMTAAEQCVLPMVDGLRPLRDILAQAKLVEFEAYEALHHLLELGVIEVSLSAAPQKVTPIVREARPVAKPSGGAVPVAAALVAISIAIGHWATPLLLTRVARSENLDPGEVSGLQWIDTSSRLTLALETYRAMHGKYPADLGELAAGHYLSPGAVQSARLQFDYQSDGATYTRTPR